MKALTVGAVPSGFKVILLSPLSLKVYISFCTISVVSPTPLKNNSVCSNIGVLISLTPYDFETSLKTPST